MKKLLIFLAASAFLFACNSQTKSEKSSTQVQSTNPEWVEVVLNVNGMTCDGCENAIKASIESLSGIDAVESSHEEGWTKVKFDQTLTSLEDIEGKITETGYMVEGEKTRMKL